MNRPLTKEKGPPFPHVVGDMEYAADEWLLMSEVEDGTRDGTYTVLLIEFGEEVVDLRTNWWV